MSGKIVLDKVIDTFRKVAAIDAEFNINLGGTASSSGVNVTGNGTAFLTEIVCLDNSKDYIGNVTSGFRKVMSITDNTHLTVESAFDVPLSDNTIKKSEIRKGTPKTLKLTDIGKGMRISLIASGDVPMDISKAPVGNKTRAMYGFIIIIAFSEPNDEEADDRKSFYDQLIRNTVDKDFTFGGICIGNTEMGDTIFVEEAEVSGYYIGVMTLTCYRNELTGNR